VTKAAALLICAAVTGEAGGGAASAKGAGGGGGKNLNGAQSPLRNRRGCFRGRRHGHWHHDLHPHHAAMMQVCTRDKMICIIPLGVAFNSASKRWLIWDGRHVNSHLL
jgi:hypothetical protein